MDERQARIQEDLRGLVSGDVLCDDVSTQLYSTDASIYQIRPTGVILPRKTADVVACVQYAAENNISIHARGAGTGLAGDSLGRGLIIDFSKYFRRILTHDDHTIRVQPGAVLERVNSYLSPLGRMFGADPAMSAVTTMGSVIALDGSGSHWLKYGSARRYVEALQIVLADGEVLDVGREPLVGGVSNDSNPRKRELINRLVEILSRSADLIRRHQPRTCVNRFGYGVFGALQPDFLDLPRLLAGSEGTLALFTEATLSTVERPRHRALAMLLFDRIENAARASQEIVPLGPAVCDLVDRRLLTVARDTDLRYEQLIPIETEAVLLVKFEGNDLPAIRESLRSVIELAVRKLQLAFDSRLAFDDDDVDLFWRLANRVVARLYRLKGSTRALPFIEDVAVPPDTLPSFLVDVQNLLKKHQTTATLFSHAGHGQLHIRPFLDLADPNHVEVMRRLASELYDRVLEIGGTISGEHAAGLSRTQFMERQYGPLYEVFREIKRTFDPQNVFNPGKVIGNDTELMTRDLRPAHAVFAADANGTVGGTNGPAVAKTDSVPPAQLVELQLSWTPEAVVDMSRSCNGCGACRSQAGEVRMCPIFRFAPREEASPRAKANVLRGVLNGDLDQAALASEEFKAVADLCVNCQMCRLECPASIDIPRLVLEAKGAYVASNGLRLSDWVMARVDRICMVGSFFRPLMNWAVSNRQARWVLEKIGGVARSRKLPKFAARPFLRRAHRRRLTRSARHSGRKVLFFVDIYANWHDPELAEALVNVLEHNGVAVYVHPNQKSSGMSMLSVGALDLARQRAAHNVALLAEAVRQGYHIVASEPSAAMCLIREYPALLDDDDARLVAENTSEACTYLWRMHRSGKLLLDFKPVQATLAYHMPCHLKALQVGSPGENLLRLIPGLRVHVANEGCSGMAGTFGLKRENFRNSLRAGWGLISRLRRAGFQAGTTECSSCKIQMEQGTTKPTIHPLKLLALAYGLNPEFAGLLSARSGELTVT